MPLALGIAIVVALSVLGMGVTAWVFWPAFKGPDAARRALGMHRLAIGSVVAILALNAAITLPLAPFLHIEQGLTAGTFTIAAVSTQIPMLLIVYMRLIMPGAISWAELGLRRLPFESVLRLGLGAGLAGLLVIELVGLLLSQVGVRSNQLEEYQFALDEGPFAFGVLLVLAGVVAPVVEELFFRGFLFGMYRRRYPVWVAYVGSSLLFTLLHLQPNRMDLAQMAGLSIGIFMLAMMLAWLYQHTGSLYPGMLAHAVNNATGLILFYAIRAQ